MTLMCAGLIGFGLHTGTLTMPAVVTTPVAHLSSAVRAWQERQADALSCEAAQAIAVRTMDDGSLDRASQLCTSAGATAP